ncbi:MAG: DEAD/DEAH box helicase, partial [Clostridia bacterium]|nr:DEAD/DEAH box helicase [Clostridia bacterium]
MTAFSELLSKNGDYVTFRDNAASGEFPLGLVGLPNIAKAIFIAGVLADTGRSAIILTQDEPTAVRLTGDLNTLGVQAVFYPSRDRSFRADESVSREYERARLGVLGRIIESEESGERREELSQAEQGGLPTNSAEIGTPPGAGATPLTAGGSDGGLPTENNGDRKNRRMTIPHSTLHTPHSLQAVVASVDAAAQFTMPASFLKNYTVILKSNAEAGYDRTIAALAAAGYTRSDMVEGEGQFSVRGSIVDFFPPDAPGPVRVEFFGDDVDSLTYFDPITQRRGEKIQKMKITPAREIIIDDPGALSEKIEDFCAALRSRSGQAVKESLLRDADAFRTGAPVASSERYLSFVYDERSTLFDYLPEAMLFVCDSKQVRDSAVSRAKAFDDDIKMLIKDGVLCKGLDKYSLTWDETAALYSVFDTVYIDNLTRGSFDTPVRALISCDAQQMPVWSGSIKLLCEDISPDLARGARAVLFGGTARSAQAIAEDLRQSGDRRTEIGEELTGINDFGNAQFVSSVDKIQIDNGDRSDGNTISPLSALRSPLWIVPGSLSSGVRFPRAGLVIAAYGAYVSNEGGVFAGERSRAVSRAKAKRDGFRSTDDLRMGDYVVHDKHGIGVFVGIRSVSLHGVVQDYIKIQYRGTDVLYVPVNQLDHITKYIAPGDESGNRTVRLSRLGSQDWTKTKARVKQSVRDIAKELIELYAKRQKTPGFAFSPDMDMQRDFELRFPYDETLDQIRCIKEIKGDMERAVPMDRLLCGDVGFGKTEVALRAAFKCVADGKQVAVLVPTTILALQHYRTVLSRFEGFPIETEMLSRFRSAKEKTDIIRRLAEGSVDIIIGTHALLGKNVKFKDIGLIIVDEEQRFGVQQKEKLKANFPFVDVLTLSATPIPRTLNMSMVG